MLHVHPIPFHLRWDDVVESNIPNLLQTTDVVDVVVAVASVIYLVVDEAVEGHLVQPLDVEVFLFVLLF